jgi:hypothetical protein
MFLENNCIQISPIIFALEVKRERPTRLVERFIGATELKNSRTTEWTAERHDGDGRRSIAIRPPRTE